jgi:hypothetical protein
VPYAITVPVARREPGISRPGVGGTESDRGRLHTFLGVEGAHASSFTEYMMEQFKTAIAVLFLLVSVSYGSAAERLQPTR